MTNYEIKEYNYEIDLVKSRQVDLETLIVNNLYLHSRYNPIDEAKKIAESSYKKNHLHILFGLGLGYIAKAISKKLSDTDQLLIIEPNIDMSKLTLDREEGKELLKHDKVQIFVGLDIKHFESFLHAYFAEYMGRFTIITSPNYPKLYPEFYKEFLEKTKEILMMEVINNNTHHMFSKLWQENFISNLYTAFTAHNIEDIKGKLTCPVVIVSSGPSLTKQLPLLKGIKNYAFIISVGSTINTLLNVDIIPDLIVTVDGGEPNYNHFRSLNIDHIPMIYPLIVHRKIPSEHKGQQIIFNISDHIIMNKWANRLLLRDIGIVQTGNSVANFSLDIAYQITSGPICIIGQDLAYTNNQSHASGNKGFSLIDDKKINERKMFYAEGYYGDEVLTDYVFHGMKKGFEQHLDNIRESGYTQEVYNCTEGGIKLKGFKQVPFQQFIESFCQSDYSKEINHFIPSRSIPTKKDWENFHNEVLLLKKQYDEVLSTATESLSILEKVRKNHYLFNKRLSGKLDNCDNKLKRLLENEFIFYLVKPTIFKFQHSYLEVEDESEEEMNKRVYDKSLVLYEGIKDATKSGLEWIDDLISKIEKNINK